MTQDENSSTETDAAIASLEAVVLAAREIASTVAPISFENELIRKTNLEALLDISSTP
jgi:hypothetical protein